VGKKLQTICKEAIMDQVRHTADVRKVRQESQTRYEPEPNKYVKNLSDEPTYSAITKRKLGDVKQK